MRYEEIHIVGDSHFGTFYSCVDPEKDHFIHYYNFSPMTMYLASQTKDFHIIPKNGLWILCFGEIDVRCLIHNQIHIKKRDENEVIETLVNNFIKNILSFYSEIAIMSVVPPIKFYDGTYNPKLNETSCPFVGPDEDRSRYAEKLNKELKTKCIEKNIIYINIYDHYKDENGFLIKELSDGNVHIADHRKVAEIMKGMDLFP